MYKLYYSPGACSLAPHIVLKELSLPHELIRVPTGEEAHHRPEYLRINPLAKLPALQLEDGEVLTEALAIMSYLAERTGSLLPDGLLERARCAELVALIGTAMHPSYAMVIRPDRVVKDPAAHDGLRSAGRDRFRTLLQHVDERLFRGPWALGERYTIADPYLFVMYAWAGYVDINARENQKLAKWAREVRARPAVEEALRAESLIDEAGRPTPPRSV